MQEHILKCRSSGRAPLIPAPHSGTLINTSASYIFSCWGNGARHSESTAGQCVWDVWWTDWDWIGLKSGGQTGTRLDWSLVDRLGLHWIEVWWTDWDCIGLKSGGQTGTALDWSLVDRLGLHWIEVWWTDWNCTGLKSGGQTGTALDWSLGDRLGLDWIEVWGTDWDWIGLKY